MVKFSRSKKISAECHHRSAVRAAPCGQIVMTRVEIYRAQVCMWYHMVVGDSVSSHKSNPQLLKRNWSEDMTRNVRCAAKNGCERRGIVFHEFEG